MLFLLEINLHQKLSYVIKYNFDYKCLLFFGAPCIYIDKEKLFEICLSRINMGISPTEHVICVT